MPYDKVFTGADGVLVFSRKEGSAADEILDFYEMEQVGRVKHVEVHAHQDVRAFYSIGTNLPIELRTGSIRIWGRIGRAYMNGALLRLLLGKYAVEGENPQSPRAAPRFDIIVQLKTPDVQDDKLDYLSKMTVSRAVLDNWSFNIPEDDFVLEEVSFQAERLLVDDKQPAEG
jgi:hypothetical protein